MNSKEHEQDKSLDEDKNTMDNVLRRMLSTPPPKPEPKKQEKKTGK